MKQEIQAINTEIVQLRHQIHAHPELKYQEFKTSKLVKEKLVSYGYDNIQTEIGKTGVVALLDSGKPGKTIALRADMDALPIQEKTELTYQSKNQGVMHACGHDGHTAALLGAAKLLIEKKKQFSGKIKFIFQPAEEGGAGAAAMIADGVLENPKVDAIFGYHNIPHKKVGIIATKANCLMASIDEFYITISGKGGHAAMPELTIDPIIITSEVIQAIQTIISRNISATQPGIISVTKINAGTTINVIPDNVQLSGAIRATSVTSRELILQRFNKLISGIVAAHGATAIIETRSIAPPTINTQKEAQFILNLAEKLYGKEYSNYNTTPLMISEDFSFYLEKIPGCFYFIGNGSPEISLHNAKYNFNDAIIPVAVEMFCQVAIEYLNNP